MALVWNKVAQIEPTFYGLHAAHDAVFAFLPLLAIITVLVAVIFLQHACALMLRSV